MENIEKETNRYAEQFQNSQGVFFHKNQQFVLGTQQQLKRFMFC
jgi:hypothetical protein